MAMACGTWGDDARLAPMTIPQSLLVTGAAGFIGSRFVASCNALGIPVIAVDATRHFKERPELNGITFQRIVDRDLLLPMLGRSGGAELPELAGIVHLGACTDTTQMDVEYLRRVNVEYSQALWTFASARRLPFVYASSAATYGAGEHGYVDDESKFDRLVPLNPYGDSKLIFDRWALAQERDGRAPPAWSGFKFFNVYGHGERHKRRMASVVLHAFDQIRGNGRVKLFKSHKPGIADGHQQRDFIHVGDVVDVLHHAWRTPLPRGVFNLGTGQARTFLDLVKATFAALRLEPAIDFIDTPAELRERYQYFTQADMTKLRKAGWSKPFTSLEDGVKAYVERLVAAG
jgi:ADP-L-glycero-D-manno-heptose 6-epimerase